MLSANETKHNLQDTMGLKEQLSKIQQRLMKLSVGLDEFEVDEQIFVSRNTAHFAEEDLFTGVDDEDEKSFQKLNCTQMEEILRPKYTKMISKPLIKINTKANLNTSFRFQGPKTPQTNHNKSQGSATRTNFKQSQLNQKSNIKLESPQTTGGYRRTHYYTEQQSVSPFSSNRPPMSMIVNRSPHQSQTKKPPLCTRPQKMQQQTTSAFPCIRSNSPVLFGRSY